VKRLVLALAGLAVLAGATVVGIRLVDKDTCDVLEPVAVSKVVLPTSRLGANGYVGFTSLQVRGTEPIRLTGATINGFSRRDVQAYAKGATYNAARGFPRALPQKLYETAYGDETLLPIDDLTLQPGAVQDVYLLVIARPVRAGTYTSSGLSIDYTCADESKGHRDMPFQITVHAVASA
jgi:hypothetical protein